VRPLLSTDNSALGWIFAVVGGGGAIAFGAWMIVSYARQALTKELPVMDGVVSVRCGGTVGALNMTYPFLRLTMDDRALQVRYPGAEFTLAYRDIESVETLKLFGRLVHISHRRSDVPPRILIATPLAPKLEVLIKERMAQAKAEG
jgi:hypothetical protein